MAIRSILPTALAATFGALTATTASAAHLSYYAAALSPLNGSGVSGNVYLSYDGPEDDGNRSLLVQVIASGLEAGSHFGHIHGFMGDAMGNVRDSVPPLSDVFDPDTAGDRDGFTELSEGFPFYGGILQSFTGLTAGADGTVRYAERFAVMAGSQLDDDVFSLDTREAVLHGITTQFAVGAVAPFPGGEVDTSVTAPGTFNALLPIAAGSFVEVGAADVPAVPLPAGLWLMGAALGSLGAARRLRRKG